MKIGILTFHRSINYGAFLQSYSLVNKIKKEIPTAQVEIIDYCTEQTQRRYSSHILPHIRAIWENGDKTSRNNIKCLKYSLLNYFALLINRDELRRWKELKPCFEHDMVFLPKSEYKICSDSFDELFEKICSYYNVVIVGSDCVWETQNYPFPNAYYLNIKSDKLKKMSYAACAQGNEKNKLTNEQIEYMRNSWNSYDYIGVRDEQTENYVKLMGDYKVEHNCDPTLFLSLNDLPISPQKVKSKLETYGVDFSKPTIALMGNHHLGKMVRRAFDREYQIVALYEKNKYADVQAISLTPFEWAVCFRFFDFTVTDKFHGTIFSLRNETPVFSFDYAVNENVNRTKIYDLLIRLDCLNHYFIGKREYSSSDIENIKIQINKQLQEFDVKKVKNAIETEKSTSKGFIDRLLMFDNAYQ